MPGFKVSPTREVAGSSPGSTTDLTPTLIGIYDSLLEPAKSLRPKLLLETAKDARNDPPVTGEMTKETRDDEIYRDVSTCPPKDPTEIARSVKLPIAAVNKSSLYSLRTKSDKNGASDEIDKCELTSSGTVIAKDSKMQRTFRESKVADSAFDNLSPNVKRMISSATETTTLKIQKKSITIGRSTARHKSNIPLVGATSKISQSGVEILQSVEIYDQPCMKNLSKHRTEEHSPSKTVQVKPDFKIDDTQTTYDVPSNNRPAIYDVPAALNKTAFESLSLPYIDQSIELSITSNDREFDIKLSSKETSPLKPEAKSPSPDGTPAKISKKMNGTNSLHRKDFKNESPSKQLLKTGPYPHAIGSTGNLKTLAIPEKEMIRLNPPAVEVSRPLSMSSIASSSSTSSSGVQNKGGVNSAYLASIESLDDHSDADMTSANGSNNFVNNAGIVNKSESVERNSEDTAHTQVIDEMSGLSQLERVCSEIVQTENVYVEDLRQVVEGYLHIWRKQTTFSDEELSELFNNIEDIYAFNRSLCEELNTCRLDATCIARCFVNNTTGFSVYTSYCTGYPRTMERLAALASKPQSAREFRERQLALGHPLPLASYLLKPVQRILKYHLLLQNVVKQCASSDTEYALLKMTGIAQHIDDMKRRHEHAVRVQEIQSLLYGWNGPDLTTYGELCAEGTFSLPIMGSVQQYDASGVHSGCAALLSRDPVGCAARPGYAAGALPATQARVDLIAETGYAAGHKREWTLLLKRVILENYNAVIPSHARQLVMELGQNKTDDDMLAEKSHNLITQASMRKQLSAPEYLEKRKMDRERRKSFENGIRGRLKKVNRKYTVPVSRPESSQECDCLQVSLEKGIDYTCDNCYVDLCSDCEIELTKSKERATKCGCRHEEGEIVGEKCPECDRSLHFIDSGSAERLERKQSDCKCSDFKSSQESFNKEFSGSLNKTRGYHSSDNIIGYTENSKSREDLSDTNNSLINVRNLPKTCLKCEKIKENIAVTETSSTLHVTRKSRCADSDNYKTDTLRSKSKDDPQRSKLSKIGTWRRKSEPGLQQNNVILKKSLDSDSEKNEPRGCEKIEFKCRNCGSNKITRKLKSVDSTIISDLELENKKRGGSTKLGIEVRMYNTKNIPKKISRLKKNRAKGLRLGSDTTAKFYADFSTDVSTENILHISESNDSLNTDKSKEVSEVLAQTQLCKDDDIDEETYKKLIEKTDSFKKNELEKVKYLNQQKVITELSEVEDKPNENDGVREEIHESGEEIEQPLEQIISQLLMQNREFQKLLKKQQQRNSAQRRHQRLLKSHSNPEHVILARNAESLKLKPKYGRQTSENLELNKPDDQELISFASKLEVEVLSDDDHIYETLRVINKNEENLQSPKTKNKPVPSHLQTKTKRSSSSPNPGPYIPDIKMTNPESDYVYLSFDKLNTQDADGIYDIPIKSPEKVEKAIKTDDYVTMEQQGPPNVYENLYDSLVEVCRRKKDISNTVANDYLPMSADQQSPNTPEIWLSRQKEHFNVSRDRKSGSLPRSFQVVTTTQEESNLNTFKCKPNSNSKTYLNRDGKVMSTDRPFTIASDKSEISYDDVENYMSDGDILKFNKSSKTNDSEYHQNISQSTLELEEEIDRCYKRSFAEIDLNKNKDEDLLTVSQPNLNTSTTSSCEVLPVEHAENTQNEKEVIHPEHKIYKPTSNLISLRNVLSRFKNKTPNKTSDDSEINANEQSSPDSVRSDLKSPSSEKRSALNPRSYSKNLLQRFKSIIGDEHADDNHNKTVIRKEITTEDVQNNLLKNDIQVCITSTDVSSTTSVTNSIKNDAISKSAYEHTTLTESQNEKNNLDKLSHSCDDISPKHDHIKPSYEKKFSMVTNISSSISSTSSPSKSNNSAYQNSNKLPIYMQGSKHLGARIAQSDYVDPLTLVCEKSAFKNVNVLINKNAVRPDSLFSNSSFVTSSSEGTYHDNQKTNTTSMAKESDNLIESPTNTISDENFYEKTFEKIEHMTDEDVFRDSAVYSDQEDTEEIKSETSTKVNKIISRVESIKREASFRAKRTTVTSNVSERTSVNNRLPVAINKAKPTENIQKKDGDNLKSKIAPPVPAKPKISNIPAFSSVHLKPAGFNKVNIIKSQGRSSSSESVNTKCIRRSINLKQSVVRSESTPNEEQNNCGEDVVDISRPNDMKTVQEDMNTLKPHGNIQMKRLSYERASLDSATRKLRTNEIKRANEAPKIASKSVLERRMEIELLSKSQTAKPGQSIKKPLQRPKPISTKVENFQRSLSDSPTKDTNVAISLKPTVIDNIPLKKNTEEVSTSEPKDLDPKGSWVKQVVNKFQ
ncbi:hypothetical protein evm_010391 [Chilo suppressalis]|nr:hypothetical protein evm_010391 [Chilo suppressalis]